MGANSHRRRVAVEGLDEKSETLVEDAVRTLLGVSEGGAMRAEEYHESLLRTVLSLGIRGKCILLGRGANLILRGQPGLHVRIVASEAKRVQRLSERWHVDPQEARARMHQTDVDRRQFIARHFKRDLEAPLLYDLVFKPSIA